MYTQTLIFGVFDRFHDGHRHFIDQAKTNTEQLIIVITKDETVALLKDKNPTDTEEIRMKHVSEYYPLAHVIFGDVTPHTWHIFERYQPDCIMLGYDQHEMETSLHTGLSEYDLTPTIVYATPLGDGTLHTSTLHVTKE